MACKYCDDNFVFDCDESLYLVRGKTVKPWPISHDSWMTVIKSSELSERGPFDCALLQIDGKDYSDEDVLQFVIQYCPFCGEKLTEE